MSNEEENICPSCAGTNFETDIEGGFVVCTDCGTILKENVIVAEVEFEEHGATSRAVGQFIGEEGQGHTKARGILPAYQDNSEVSIARARKNIIIIANNPQINLPSSAIDASVLYYKMALFKGLTRSRCVAYVSVACLYIVCRLRQTAHLLIDFSEVTQTDVFVLGKVYQLIARELGIQLPIVDPCIYVERYGYKLKLGEKTRDVCHTAVRLVGRMKRDWIHHGRRPNGICGAALLVASQLHGFQISVKQMVRVVRISKAIIVKRLADVSETPVASLSLEDFFSKKLESMVEQDPPSFKLARIIYLRRSVIESKNNWLSSQIIDQVVKTNMEMEVVMGIREAIEMGINSVHKTHELIPFTPKKRSQSFTNFEKETSSKIENVETIPSNEPLIEPYYPPPDSQEINSDDEEEIDDEEIDDYILDEEEVKIKTKVWYSENAGYLAKQEQKKKQKENDQKTSRRRISKGPRRRMMGLSKMVIDHLVEGKELPQKSSKINYEALEKLNNGEHINSTDTAGTTKPQSLIDMFLDPKRYHECVDMRVPDHTRLKYEQKQKNETNSEKIIIETVDKLKPKKNTQKKSKIKPQPVQTEISQPLKSTPDSPTGNDYKTVDDEPGEFNLSAIQKRKKNLEEELYRKSIKLFGFEDFEKKYGLPEEGEEEEEFFDEFIY